MLGENKNLKDTPKNSIKDTASNTTSMVSSWQDHFSYYARINKLITALYMVTDTMEKEEPLRLKLRTLGIEILSDISAMPKGTFDIKKTDQVLSFLNIASDVGMVSEMNCNILGKEFIKLKQSIQEFTTKNNLWFEEFVSTSSSDNEGRTFSTEKARPSLSLNKGQSTRIGVQKGSTLMKALSEVGDRNNKFEMIKNQRRESIIKIIRNKPDGISIKDIILALRNLADETGEKTLQRELISMVKDNVLKKTGEKRWSLYFIPPHQV